MWYQKLLEVREDSERVYFTFFTEQSEKTILALPKNGSSNQGFYMGKNYESLDLVSSHDIKNTLSELTRKALKNSPYFNLCSSNAVKLLG